MTIIIPLLGVNTRGLVDWINASGDLHLISSLEETNILTPETLSEWIDTAESARVLEQDGTDSIAFCTLSRSEAPLPPEAIEVCHLIVHPQHRRRYRASQLLLELTQSARELGYRRLVGRTVPRNTIAHEFLASLERRIAHTNDTRDEVKERRVELQI